MNQKSEVQENFKNFKALVKKQIDLKIQKNCSDNGGEHNYI